MWWSMFLDYRRQPRAFLQDRVIWGLVLAPLLIAGAGCSTTYQVQPGEAGAGRLISCRDATERLKDSNVWIQLAGGGHFHASGVEIQPDSTRFQDDSLDAPLRVATSSIVFIRSTDRGAGALKGLLYGGIVGGLSLWTLGSRETIDGRPLMSAGTRIIVGSIGGGISGALFGLIAGDRETYEFVNRSPVRQNQNDPSVR